MNQSLTGAITMCHQLRTKTWLSFFSVKAVLSSGENAISYSNGFYIDTTAPTFDSRVFMYVNVDQGDFTPSKYQSSNSTIKGVWLCVDDENEIEVCLPFSLTLAFINYHLFG